MTANSSAIGGPVIRALEDRYPIGRGSYPNRYRLPADAASPPAEYEARYYEQAAVA